MSFHLTRLSRTNAHVTMDYKRIAEEFCLEYYTLYDNNIESLQKLYHPEAKFVYLDHEFISFHNWSNALRCNNYYKFTHNDMSINVIAVNNLNLLITITGTMIVNNSCLEQKFTENILLQKDVGNNFYICTTIFKFLE